MDGYREFWNELIFGSASVGPESLERYWAAVGVFVALCFIAGLASRRVSALAPSLTVAVVVAYVAALLPFVIWTISCTGCGASFNSQGPRSEELAVLNMTWGGFFAMGAAAIWLGVLAARSFEFRLR